MADSPPPPRPKNRAPPPPKPKANPAEGGGSKPAKTRSNPGPRARPPKRGGNSPARRRGPPRPRKGKRPPHRGLPKPRSGGPPKPRGGGKELPELPGEAPAPEAAGPVKPASLTPWAGRTSADGTSDYKGREWPLAEVVKIIAGVTLDDEGNVRRYTTTAPHGPGHLEIIYARNESDGREELAVGMVAAPMGRTPPVKGYGPADMLTKFRKYDNQGYDPIIMAVLREARDYLRDYIDRLL